MKYLLLVRFKAASISVFKLTIRQVTTWNASVSFFNPTNISVVLLTLSIALLVEIDLLQIYLAYMFCLMLYENFMFLENIRQKRCLGY